MKNSYFILQNPAKNRTIYKMKVCAVASEIALMHGIYNCSEELIYKYWTHQEYAPSVESLKKRVTIKNIRWYIRD